MHKDQDQLPFSIPCKQVGCADEYVRAEMWRFRERTQRGWKRSVSSNCRAAVMALRMDGEN